MAEKNSQPKWDTAPAYNFNQDPEHQNQWSGDNNSFENQAVRNNFVKKVTGILGTQLAITFGFVLLVAHNKCDTSLEYESCDGFREGYGIFSMGLVFFSMATSFILLFGAICCFKDNILKKSPHNMIFLFTWTILETHLVAYITLRYPKEIVLLAMGTTAVVTLTVSAIVHFSGFDFSKLLPAMIGIVWIWLFVAFFGRYLFGSFTGSVAYGVIGATIFAVFLAIDLKMLMGGGKYELETDEYVFGAIAIYLDIINIFIYLLQAFSGSD